jgi:hypothetical protein
MSDEIHIDFFGPFSWPGTADAPSVYDSDEGMRAGLYLWTMPLDMGHLIYYVGETERSFRARLFEHYIQHAAGTYHVYSSQEFARGEKVQVWPGRFDRSCRKFEKETILAYHELSQHIWAMTLMMRFFLAPLTCEQRTRKRAEAAIANALYGSEGIIGAFQDRGVRYCPRVDAEVPINCLITSTATLLGMPQSLSI